MEHQSLIAGARSGGRKLRRLQEQTPLQMVLGWVCILLQSLYACMAMAGCWLRDLLVEVFGGIIDITAHGLDYVNAIALMQVDLEKACMNL